MRRSSPQSNIQKPEWLKPLVCFFWFGGLIAVCFHGMGAVMLMIALFLMTLDKNPGSAL